MATTINEQIIEALYGEALMLADEARLCFDMRIPDRTADANDLTRVALSIEGLRSTTRLMHTLAWLLNQRAYLAGEMSEGQLRRLGPLPEDRPSEPDQLALLEPETRALIRESERLHARVARLDGDWRAQDPSENAPVLAMHGRLAQAFKTG
ncbi:DUF1465 family protein [Qipengyuania marisflavi]|nr:DUF1465 family protein [Qipengyuania marisflavi]